MGEIKYPTPTALPGTVVQIHQTIAFRGRELIGPFEISEPPRVKNSYTRCFRCVACSGGFYNHRWRSRVPAKDRTTDFSNLQNELKGDPPRWCWSSLICSIANSSSRHLRLSRSCLPKMNFGLSGRRALWLPFFKGTGEEA